MGLLVMGAKASFGQDTTNAPAEPVGATASFFFRSGDQPAIFLGDSITEQRLYTTLIETYTLSRFPNMKINFRNAGWDGDTSWLTRRGKFDAALKRDVLDLQPKVVVIDFGMNDARGGDANYTKYLESTTALVKGIEKVGGRVLLLTPSPEERYEPNAPAGSSYNVMLKKYCDGLKIVADNEKVPLLDQFTPFVAYIEAGRKAGVLSATGAPGDPTTVSLTNDGIHPNWGGHLLMATIILQGMHATAEVSSMTLDAAAHSITATDSCDVEIQDAPAGTVKFKRSDVSLPWPIPSDPKIVAALKIPGFDPETALNQYELKVTGLKEVAYTLFIDDRNSGVYTSADLANGVNLATTMTQGPIYDQEQDLLKAVMAKNDLYFHRWRDVQLFEMPDWLEINPGAEAIRKQELGRLDGLIDDAEKNIESLRQPVPHIFRLVPVPK
jgi:lysophospholipase L1-like esterase